MRTRLVAYVARYWSTTASSGGWRRAARSGLRLAPCLSRYGGHCGPSYPLGVLGPAIPARCHAQHRSKTKDRGRRQVAQDSASLEELKAQRTGALDYDIGTHMRRVLIIQPYGGAP